MKILLSLSFLLIIAVSGKSQNTDFKVYSPDADATLQINEAVAKANAKGKHVLVEIGGNWCKWCRMFYKFSHETASVDSLLNAEYVVVYLNYSKENKNIEVLNRFGKPQRFGFPVFMVLDGSGTRIHTQNTGYLEDGEGYSEKKVLEFLNQWSPSALSKDYP